MLKVEAFWAMQALKLCSACAACCGDPLLGGLPVPAVPPHHALFGYFEHNRPHFMRSESVKLAATDPPESGLPPPKPKPALPPTGQLRVFVEGSQLQLLLSPESRPSGSISVVGLFSTYAYRLRDCGLVRSTAASPAGSGEIQLAFSIVLACSLRTRWCLLRRVYDR